MDELDKKILMVLQEDARLSYTKIAKRVGTSTATVSERVRKLQESDIIKGYSVVLNSSKIGITTLITMICVKPSFDVAEIGETIAELKETCCVHNITGDFDLIVSFKCFSPTEREECTSIINKINRIDGIERVNTYMVLNTIKEESQIGL
ncbi:MAG: Lrp/AsnC family transcriptional regulator [Candidatus Methanolliviera hydrocarbonicum]|uniref:Lrp/AsnC family transcriptional regulator n=1 Tax=Candidatus Methanolliviera hydrocarbonicum TaxID=2491085 RepID=A0A520KXN6_9EURY|nr:MAG: Lrp/AsnC family transcriptional regulator [Candidatus Methanolliviera hydrocarbonicum]